MAQPAFFEPKEHFYKAKGAGLTVKWHVPNTVVEDGDELPATLVIGSTRYPVLNPTEVMKPDLKLLPAFDRFTVTDVPDPPRGPGDKEVRFGYKLRPRNRSVEQIPALEFYYLNTAAAPGKSQYRKTQADSVPITVTEPRRPEAPRVPMVEAEHLFRLTTGPGVLHAPFVPCRWAWLAAGLFGPLAAAAWFLAWRRVFPDAVRAARLRRSRVARRATEAIRKAGRTPDPAATVAAAVLAYLRARFPVPESAATPSEIAAVLKEMDVPGATAEATADVFRACDRARFAPPGDSGAALAVDAEAAIARLEALA
ncbi:hypothetical protein [Frigoriglobus tundricola]|uniref:Protein BatD n=1 Tax=Frigoriglobus tundricola TaxID=2774151 RepID=A0A6M5YS99_9BACT|nr:hypothetical protein [Frigoriglobus tundricola]QJW95862.1 hypothetical protein FTUN_3416 [Frigoriglobus tundricola]